MAAAILWRAGRLREAVVPASDVLLAVAVTVLSLGMLLVPGERVYGSISTLAIVLTLLGTLPLVARRQWPMAVLAVSAVA